MPAPTGNLVYCLVHRDGVGSYVGWTNKFARRLRQHNGEIKGGARQTLMRGPGWSPLFLVTEFKTPRHARQLEKRLHDHRGNGMRRQPLKETAAQWRTRRLVDAMARERFYSTAPVTEEAHLLVTFYVQ